MYNIADLTESLLLDDNLTFADQMRIRQAIIVLANWLASQTKSERRRTSSDKRATEWFHAKCEADRKG